MSELEELLSRLEHAVLVLGCSNCGNITDEGIRAAEKKNIRHRAHSKNIKYRTQDLKIAILLS